VDTHNIVPVIDMELRVLKNNGLKRGNVLIILLALVVLFSHRNFIRLAKDNVNEQESQVRRFLLEPFSTTDSVQQNNVSSTSVYVEGNDDSNGKSKPNTVIFLNAYIGNRNPDLGIGIVHEQIEQLVNESQIGDYSTLYYNVIGNKYEKPICPPDRNCKMLGYYPKGFEEITLSSLYNHCLQNPTDYVVYLHNKGSFHPGGSNTRRRRLNTKAALSNACRGIQSTNNTCNVCAFRFETHPFSHVPGNFFQASCEYVRKLIPPKSYDTARRKLCETVVNISDTPIDFCPNDTIGENMESVEYGFGRMAMERWIPSHPSFVPCTVFDLKRYALVDFVHGNETWQPNLQIARHNNRRFNTKQRQSMELLMHEHFLLYNSRNHSREFCKSYFIKRKDNSCPFFPYPLVRKNRSLNFSVGESS